MHYYQFNIGDYASSTQHLDDSEDLAYRRMLDIYYSKESALPDDQNQIARLIRMRTHTDCIATVLSEFFVLKKDGYHCARADKEIKAFKAKSDSAKRSAEARWNKTKDLEPCERIPNAKQSHSEGNAKHKTLNTKQEPLNNKQSNKPAKAVIDFSSFGMSEHQIIELKRIRSKNKGGAITQRVANGLSKEFHQAAGLGYTFDELLTEWELRGWKSLKSEWFKPKPGVAQNHSAITEQNINNIGEWLNE